MRNQREENTVLSYRSRNKSAKACQLYKSLTRYPYSCCFSPCRCWLWVMARRRKMNKPCLVGWWIYLGIPIIPGSISISLHVMVEVPFMVDHWYQRQPISYRVIYLRLAGIDPQPHGCGSKPCTADVRSWIFAFFPFVRYYPSVLMVNIDPHTYLYWRLVAPNSLLDLIADFFMVHLPGAACWSASSLRVTMHHPQNFVYM